MSKPGEILFTRRHAGMVIKTVATGLHDHNLEPHRYWRVETPGGATVASRLSSLRSARVVAEIESEKNGAAS